MIGSLIVGSSKRSIIHIAAASGLSFVYIKARFAALTENPIAVIVAMFSSEYFFSAY